MNDKKCANGIPENTMIIVKAGKNPLYLADKKE